MTGNDETTLTEEDVRVEHRHSAQPTAHWVYLFGVLGGGLLAMLSLIALLGSTS